MKKIPPTASNNLSKDTNKPAKNGPAPAMPNNSDIRPAKSKADAVDVAPVRPSKQQQQQQQQHQQPQKEKQQSQAATAVEDFPTLGIGNLLTISKFFVKVPSELNNFKIKT